MSQKFEDPTSKPIEPFAMRQLMVAKCRYGSFTSFRVRVRTSALPPLATKPLRCTNRRSWPIATFCNAEKQRAISSITGSRHSSGRSEHRDLDQKPPI